MTATALLAAGFSAIAAPANANMGHDAGGHTADTYRTMTTLATITATA